MLLICYLIVNVKSKRKILELKLRKTMRNCIRKGVKCQKFRTRKYREIPGISPNDAVGDVFIFEIVGCDFNGALYL